MSKHLDLFHRRLQEHGASQVNVNDVHRDTLTWNDRIAQRVSAFVGTMWFCYGLAFLMFAWALVQQAILPVLHMGTFDPYPFAFLFFILGGVMQSLLMPLIMTAQNLDARHSELRAEADHHINQDSAQKLEQIATHQQTQDACLLRIEQVLQDTKTNVVLLREAQIKLMQDLHGLKGSL